MTASELLSETEPPRVEILRSKSLEEVEVVVHLLKEAGIECRASRIQSSCNYTQLGHLDVPEDGVVTVAQADLRAARDVLELAFAKEELPPGHFLRTATDEDLYEVLAEPDDWSAFDVAHARRLARERGLNPDQQKAAVEELKRTYEQGVPAPGWLITLGWTMAFIGGVFGIGIGYRIAYWKVERSLGEFYIYDEASREKGKPMFYTGIVMTLVWRFLLTMARTSS